MTVIRDGVIREHDHREGCFTGRADYGPRFIVTDRDRPLRHDLKRNGHKGGSTMWWVFTCNDIRCPARLLVRWDVLAGAVAALSEEDV